MPCLVARTGHLVTPHLRPRSRISPMGLTVREGGREWHYGAPIHNSYLQDSLGVFRYYKKLGERAMAQCPEDALFTARDTESNSIAIIVKHMAGNMRSRWTDFLTTDGEKPDRNRDTEFEEPPRTRTELMELWDRGWKLLFGALEPLSDADPTRTITIRPE